MRTSTGLNPLGSAGSRATASGIGTAIATALATTLAIAMAAGCAVNLSEGRPARVLRGGEMQVTEVNNVVVPFSAVGELVDAGRTAAKSDIQNLTDEEKRDLVGSAAAIAFSSPGWSSHMELTVGLGYRIDASARIGNGVYALGLRRGFDLGRWDSSLGIRGAYNQGTWIPYLSTVNDLVKVADAKRFDGQVIGQLGREFGDWGRFWVGGKAVLSQFAGSIDATRIGIGKERVNDRLMYYGGFAGLALGYRVIYFVAEVTALYASGDITVFDERYSLSGLTVVPTWGFQGTF